MRHKKKESRVCVTCSEWGKTLFTTLHRLKLLTYSELFLDFPIVSQHYHVHPVQLHTARKTDRNFLTLAGTVGLAAGKGH